MFRRTAWVFAMAVLACSSSRESAAFTGWDSVQGAYEVQLMVNGVPAREYYHGGRNYVMGSMGDRYAIRVRNNTGRRVEVVATVDGLDVVDGKPGDFVRKRGYVIGPYQTYDIEGFRTSLSAVAAFRFSSVADSYAARTGSSRNVGVIGVAFFAERPPVVYRPAPRPIAPPRDGYWGLGGAGRAEEKSASADAAEQAPAAGAMSSRSRGDYGGGYERRGLGTEFGERRASGVHETSFVRASSGVPSALVTVYYNDFAGLRAMGVLPPDPPPPPDEPWTRHTADPFPATPPERNFATPPDGWYYYR
jgi:hypothetical protein